MASRTTSRASSEIQEPLLVYVHGIGAQPPRDELKLQWDLALFGRGLGDRSRFAYWADLLHPPLTAGAVGAKRTRARAAAAEDPERALERWLGSRARPRERRFAGALAAHVGLATTGTARGPGKKVLPLPAPVRRAISRAFLQRFVADTAAYFFTPGLRQKIRQRLGEQIEEARGRPITLVAHSQGTVIAYEVLSAMLPAGALIDEWVTLGSPLGIQEVQDFLDPVPPRVPQRVPRWHNFADPIDPVALDKRLANDFAPASGSGVTVQDEIIVNPRSRTLPSFNPHSAVGYLAHPSVRRVVSGSMRMDIMARFVLARDVAERLGAPPEERHPVLVEVLEPGYGALGEAPEQTHATEARETARIASAKEGGEVALTLEHRVASAAQQLRAMVGDKEAARIDPLRRFVAAHLTAGELQRVAEQHREMRVYAVWRSSRKSKLTDSRSMRAIKADAALASFGAGGDGITWAVLDTGVQADHPHFAAPGGPSVIAAVYDCTRRGAPRRLDPARDRDGHGTHVCGIIAGRSAPGVAVGPAGETDLRGVAPRTRLVVYKVLDDDGQGEDAWIIKALDHIASQNENVVGGPAIQGVNLSLGGPFDDTVYGCGFSPICAELRRLWRGGVLVVVACGNEGQLQVQTPDGDQWINTPMSVGDPANLEECIAVGAVNADRPHLYGISPFSSRGPTADGRVKPDVVAPGERILSCNAHWNRARNAYIFESGTSMAAPHVSGLLAAFLSARREFRGRPDEVKRILLDACTDLGRDHYHQGRGLPNLMQMLLNV